MACCCLGGFCELVLPNKDDNNSLIKGNGPATHLPNNKKRGASLSKREKRLQNSLERDRIIGLLKWVLTTEEYLQLEETGDLVRLRAVNKNSSHGAGVASTSKSSDTNNDILDGFWIDGESVNLAKKEHRPNLARLAFAEFQSLSPKCKSSDDSEPTTIVLPTCEGNEGDVAVCEVCFNVYTLLKQARKLLASSHREAEENQDETTTLEVGQESGNNPPANKAANNSALNGKIGAATNKLGKLSTNTSSSASDRGPTTSPQQKSGDNDSHLKSKRKEKQKKRDRDKMEKNAKIHVLVAESDEATNILAKQILEKEGYTVDSVTNSNDCLQALKNKSYSILLLNESLSGKDDELIAIRIRQDDATSNRRVKMRILVVVQNILSVNYNAYQECEVDGFLPMPLEGSKLVSSIRKAVSKYSEAVLRAERKRIAEAKQLNLIGASEDATNKDSNQPKSLKPADIPKSNDSAKHVKSATSTSIKGISSKPKKKEPIASESRFQYDEKTSFPYAILENCSDESTNQSSLDRQPHHWCNLLVCHDVFDTYERFKIFFLPMVARYPGMKILLWNYPGQAFTSFIDDANLNNKYHADCLSKLLDHVKSTEKGKLFMDEQFFILAHGSGAAIATYFAANQCITNLRGMILVNGLSHVDSHFASVFHDCWNVFSCSPESRPDLPVYFYARFLFSPSYLSKTTSSLALNVYTAVHNPITLNGRKRLCQGVLNHVDTRPMLKDIGIPIISIHGENATLVRAIHSTDFLTGRRSCSTIPQALKGGNRTALVMMKGGHELFQEKKYHISLLVEQILTGFHEQVRVQQQPTLDFEALQGNSNSSHDFLLPETKVEDVFIDRVVKEGRDDQALLDRYQNEIMVDPESSIQNKSGLRKTVLEKEKSIKASEAKSDIDDHANPELKEVKEYMAWRIKRQKKRLAVMEHSAIVIQCALRCYLAKASKVRLRKHKAATRIQCYTRGIFGRLIYQRTKHELWAAMFLQRATRGHLGRCTAFNNRMQLRAQIILARVMRGVVARRKYHTTLTRREYSASKIQCIWRMHAAIILKNSHHARRVAATTIQKCYRGRVGRREAAMERERYIFSRNQLSGIESGRQILSEHKLLATNLQSDVFLLNQEKEKLEKKIEYHLAEIIYFERNVLELETKMHLLFNGDLVCASESAVREEKRRINEEITDATAKILDRKESLEVLKQSLEHVSRDRQEKLEQSKELEAKLAVLLDAQVTALEGVLDKKGHRIERVVSTNSKLPSSSDETSQIESNIHPHSPVPPKSMNQPKQFEKLEAFHPVKNQVQTIEHQLSSMSSPSKSNVHPLWTPKKDMMPPLQPVMPSVADKWERGKHEQSIVPSVSKQPLSSHGNAHIHSPLPASSTTLPGNKDASNYDHSGPSEKDKMQAAQLIDSTETMLKFGFMSMSLTYFSTLNMMRAMQKVAVSDTLSASAANGEEFSNAVSNNSLMHTRTFGKTATVLVESWSINDVSKWLASISLSQYQSAFKEGAVDGAFLCELSDEDLRNTLGVEHRLHRKKILFSIRCLKNYSEAPTIQSPTSAHTAYDDNSTIYATNVGRYPNKEISPESLEKSPGKPISVRDMLTPTTSDSARYLNPDNNLDMKSPSKSNSVRDMITPTKSDKSTIPKCNYDQLSAWVRHQKYDNIRDAMEHMPDLHFDGKKHVRVQFIENIGTAYTPQYDHEPFHLNNADEHGNTLVHIAAQTGNIKICKLLLRKGANPNHQNKQGQTPGHFAVAYQFFEFASWLFDEKGGGADDLLTNIYGLGPYDGLQQ